MTLEIVFNEYNGVFFAGAEVSGYVRMRLSEPMKAERITLKASGKVKTAICHDQ